MPYSWYALLTLYPDGRLDAASSGSPASDPRARRFH